MGKPFMTIKVDSVKPGVGIGGVFEKQVCVPLLIENMRGRQGRVRQRASASWLGIS